jgi:hypothetical protein
MVKNGTIERRGCAVLAIGGASMHTDKLVSIASRNHIQPRPIRNAFDASEQCRLSRHVERVFAQQPDARMLTPKTPYFWHTHNNPGMG